MILVQYSVQAFYDPARTASIPLVVAPQQICAASTLDTFGFSLMALIGATAVSHRGWQGGLAGRLLPHGAAGRCSFVGWSCRDPDAPPIPGFRV